MKLDELLAWYGSLTPESVARVREFYHEEASFRDPFNKVSGHRAIEAVFQHMFENCTEPRFTIKDAHQSGDYAWVTWRFTLRLRGAPAEVEGVSRLRFEGGGRISEHCDYWDSLEMFAAMPMLGPLFRFMKGKMAAERGA